jgi:hypothetical protein
MPVEITMPLTKLEQAVDDARKNERVMAAKVEEAKLALKSAKTAWEEAVGEVFRALDEMIADKRQMRLPFDEDEAGAGGSPGSPDPSAPGGEPVPEPVTVTIVTPTAVEVQPPEVIPAPLAMLTGSKADAGASAAGLFDDESAAAPTWRSMVVAEELDGPASLFDVLSVFGVTTLGQLADALKAGRTFNLLPRQVLDLYEAIEDVSADDAEPIRFDREALESSLTVKEEEPAAAAKPAKKPRGKKAKDQAEPEEMNEL